MVNMLAYCRAWRLRYTGRFTPALRRRAAGHDIAAAERQLLDLDVLDHLLQMPPRAIEAAEVPHVGRVQQADHGVQGHHHRRGPFAPAGGPPHPAAHGAYSAPPPAP